MDETNPLQNSGINAPPPPPEVKVRTMRSDLESMAKSGGGLPHFQSVKVEGLSAKEASLSVVSEQKGKSNAKAFLITVLITAVLLVLGYFAYVFFIK
jgi:hypothetical protein